MSCEEKCTKQVPAVVVEIPVVNDSSAGLARMYEDLAPGAARLRGAAISLLFFSILFMGSLEGLFGLIAAFGVLCCAAPGSLGTAYAARCTRITATVSAVIAFMHVTCMVTFAYAVLPEMPRAIHHVCPEMEGVAVRQDAKLFVAPHHEAGMLPSSPATFVATVATTAARRLQEFSPPVETATHACERAERFFTEAAPTVLLLGIFVEVGLFVSALMTAKAAARLMLQARACGANAL